MSHKMNKSHYVGVLLLCSFMLSSVLAAVCPFKECTCGQTDILCNDLGLVTMPQKTIKKNMYFTNVLFDRNMITTVTAGSLPGNLSGISFIENPITTIEDDAFDESANTLTDLSFSQANFIRLPEAFVHLNTLKSLSISESIIQVWNNAALKQIGVTLDSLLLENIALKKWPFWMQFFTNLTELGIAGCLIPDIPDAGLDMQVTTLTDLSLNNNSLTKVPFAISKLTSLKLLALDKNKLTEVKWLPQSSKLQSLALNNNRLHNFTELSTMLRVYADTLVDFDIQDNLLTSFPTFDYLVHVFEFDFQHNKLADPNSGSLPSSVSQLKLGKNSLPRIPRILSTLQNIQQLYLGTNAITDLEGTAFPPFTRGVELEHNLIKSITNTSFPVNASITYILLSNNPLVMISDNAFVNLPHLVELNLQSTKLTRLPLALSSLVKIDVFDITNTETLVCTCLEKSLRDWIVKLPAEMVKGNCGQASIYYFYSILSLDCP